MATIPYYLSKLIVQRTDVENIFDDEEKLTDGIKAICKVI